MLFSFDLVQWRVGTSNVFPAVAGFRAADVVAPSIWLISQLLLVSMSIVQCPCYLYWHCILSALTHTVQRLSNIYCRTDLLSVIGLSEYRISDRKFWTTVRAVKYQNEASNVGLSNSDFKNLSLASSVRCYRYIQGKLALTISMHRRRILCTLQFPLHF